MLQSTHKYLINTAVIIPGEINLITSGDGVDFASLPDVTGNKTITMDLWLNDTSSNMYVAFSAGGQPGDFLLVTYGVIPELGQVHLSVHTKNSPSLVRKAYNISAYLNQMLTLEIVKTSSAITSVKANGNTLTNFGSLFFDNTGGPFYYVRGDHNASIWNLEIVGSHKWIGYPYGNTNGAWLDTIGINHGTIAGTPGTRNLF